jgi:hypothetical protein
MFRIVLVPAGLLLCLGLQARVAASAAASPDPVTIEECRVASTRSYVSAYRPLELVFTNRAAVAAKEVRFTVGYGGRREEIVDKGTFSPNVPVDHFFAGFYNVRYQGPFATCAVDSVEFEDGTTWVAAASSPAAGTTTAKDTAKVSRDCWRSPRW